MSDSLRDRVAREAMLVHYKPEAVDKEQAANGPSWRDYSRIADALIAAGLVGTEREVGMRGAYGAIIGGPERDFGTLWSVPLFERYVTPWREVAS